MKAKNKIYVGKILFMVLTFVFLAMGNFNPMFYYFAVTSAFVWGSFFFRNGEGFLEPEKNAR